MNCDKSFDKVRVTEKSSKYVFKIGDNDISIPGDYKITVGSDLCKELCIIFTDIEHMHRFQAKTGIKHFTPYYYNCDECDYHTNQKGNYKKHIESNKCRCKRGLEPLADLDKERYNKHKKSNIVYYCEVCNYSPKLKSSKASMKTHMKTKKHGVNCKKNKISIDLCMTSITE